MPQDASGLSRLSTAAIAQANRLLDLRTPQGDNRLVAETLSATEQLSDGAFRLELTALSDDALLDAIEQHPILLNRPFVTTPLGTRLCRPSEQVLDILPAPQQGAFTKEDGEAVIDAQGKRIAK